MQDVGIGLELVLQVSVDQWHGVEELEDRVVGERGWLVWVFVFGLERLHNLRNH